MRKTKSNSDQASSRLFAFVLGGSRLKFNLLVQQICEAFRVIVDQSVWVSANFSTTAEWLERGKEREREGGHGAFSVPTIEQTYVSRIRHA